jgi:hypothetical protein
MKKKISDPQNIYLLLIFGALATIYGPQFLPNIPKPIIDLFKTKWFRAVTIFLAIFLAQKDIVLSIVITTIFLIIMNIIQNKVLLETFMVNYNHNMEGFLDAADIPTTTNSNLINQNSFYNQLNPKNNSTSYGQYIAMDSSFANTQPKANNQSQSQTSPSPPSNQTRLSHAKILPLSTYDTCPAINQQNAGQDIHYVDLSQHEVGNVATSNDCPLWDGILYKDIKLEDLAGTVYMGVRADDTSGTTPDKPHEPFKNKTDTDLNSFPLSNCNAYNPVNLNLIGTSYYPINPNN